MFNVFFFCLLYWWFLFFTANILPCSRDPPKRLHDWKHKFFYIRHGVIPIDMHYRLAGEGVPKLSVAAYADEEWYKTLTRTLTVMLQLDETASVAVGMSMLCAPTNLRATPIYGYKNKVNPCWLFSFAILSLYVRPLIVMFFTTYGLINALDPKRPWLEHIQDNFHHPTEESLSIHVATPTGAHPFASVKPEVVRSPARGEIILLLSEESTASSDDLIHRSRATRTGPQMQLSKGSGGAVATNLATVGPEGTATKPTSKRPSRLHYLDYVVVFDTLSSLDISMKPSPEEVDKDQTTLTQIMEKKRDLLADAMRKLDIEATLNVSEKKRKLMGQPVGPTLSESDVDLSVASLRSRRLTTRSSKPTTPDISSIPGPESPHAAICDELPVRDLVCPEDVKGKGLKGIVKSRVAEKVETSTLPGVVFCQRVEGVETDAESSEATPV
ncbi:hypothetical protein Hanom_Chr00s000002g01601161 [Helianthus anomalus]